MLLGRFRNVFAYPDESYNVTIGVSQGNFIEQPKLYSVLSGSAPDLAEYVLASRKNLLLLFKSRSCILRAERVDVCFAHQILRLPSRKSCQRLVHQRKTTLRILKKNTVRHMIHQ